MTSYYSKPNYPYLNSAHPLTGGLTDAWLFNELSGATVYNYVAGDNRNGAMNLITEGNRASSEYGQCLSISAATRSYMTMNKPTIPAGTSSASFSILLKKWTATSPGQGETGAFRLDGGADANHYVWTNGLAYFNTFRNSRVGPITLSGSINRTNWHLVTFTTDGSLWKMYQNNINVHSTAAQATINIGNYEIGRSNSVYYFDGQIGGAWLWIGRALTEFDIAQMVDDPFQMFRRRELIIPNAPTTSYFRRPNKFRVGSRCIQ